ncbi:MAG: response regulator [Bacteroidota bacterium]|nr:response regulator [Bacteroidota bacterium]
MANARRSRDLVRPVMHRADILLVDDLAEKILVYRTILEDMDVNLIVANSGPAALKEVLRREFAVILLDVNMPGMDGFETATLIRQRKRSSTTPIIFLTAFSDDVRMTQGYASGAVDYIPTPIIPEILRAKVQVFVELYQMRKQSASQAEEQARRAAAEEEARRSSFLAEAGTVFTRSHDLEFLVDSIARAAVPFLADLSVLAISDGKDNIEQVRSHWLGANSTEHGHFHQLSNDEDTQNWLMDSIDRAIRTREFRILSGVPVLELQEEISLDDEARHASPAPEVGGGSALVLPLHLRDTTHGVLVLIRRSSSPVYQASDVALAGELAARAAAALENARLVQGIQEADQRKDEFLGMLAHELRNPLGPMRNAVEILGMLGPHDPTIEHAMQVMDRQVKHMARLVDDLLDATRIARGKVLLRQERCDLRKIVKQTTEDYRNLFTSGDVTLNIELPKEEAWLMGDPTRLAQAIGNLLHNANKFTESGGTVDVVMHVDEDEHTAEISIHDSGIGIEPQILAHIFDVFRQADQGLDRSRGGLGLGLTLVKGLVEMHGGTVGATSEGAGKGSVFTVRLPIKTGVEIHQPNVEDTIDGSNDGFQILIIEDNTDAAESARMLLTIEGHEVRIAASGKEALKITQEFKPQVVLCDIGLPTMNGYEVAKAFRADPDLANVHLIALTGYGRMEDQGKAFDAGFDLHLTKPVEPKALRKALAKCTEPKAVRPA